MASANMTPSLSVPTDNIYKFTSLFGLALIVVSIVSFVSIYTSSLDRKIRYAEIVIRVEAQPQRSKADDDLLALNKTLLGVTKENERLASSVIGAALCIGILLSAFGAHRWHHTVQQRDDKLALLQVEKLEAEIAKLKQETAAAHLPTATQNTPMSA